MPSKTTDPHGYTKTPTNAHAPPSFPLQGPRLFGKLRHEALGTLEVPSFGEVVQQRQAVAEAQLQACQKPRLGSLTHCC